MSDQKIVIHGNACIKSGVSTAAAATLMTIASPVKTVWA